MKDLKGLQDRINCRANQVGDVDSQEAITKLLNLFSSDYKDSGNYWRGTPQKKPHVWDAFLESKEVTKIINKYLDPKSSNVTQIEAVSELMVNGLVLLKIALKTDLAHQEATRLETELLEMSAVLCDVEERVDNLEQ